MYKTKFKLITMQQQRVIAVIKSAFMRVELIGGNAKVITIMLRDGWKIINTFPNPYPEPYFFVLL